MKKESARKKKHNWFFRIMCLVVFVFLIDISISSYKVKTEDKSNTQSDSGETNAEVTFSEKNDTESENTVNSRDWVFSDDIEDSVYLTSSDAIYINEESTIVLSLYSTHLFTGDIALYLNDTFLGMMHDDGLDGDQKANDGKYSYTATINSTVLNEKYDFYAVCGALTSEHEVLYSYNHKTSFSDYAESLAFMNSMNEELEKYCVNGYVPWENKNETLDILYEFALDYIDEHEIVVLEMHKESDSISFLCGDGMSFLIQIPLEGVESSDSNIEIFAIEPFCSAGDVPLNSFDSNAEYIANKVPFCSYEHRLIDNDMTIEDIINAFSENNIILWHGHGGHNANGPFLMTNIEYTEDVFIKYPYAVDYNQLVLVDNKIGISSRFIDEYFNNLDNSFVYLGACHSLETNSLAESFLNKGAELVVGFSDTVYASYDSAVMEKLSKELCMRNIFSYRSFIMAYSNIVNKLGEDDLEYAKSYMALESYKDERASFSYAGNVYYHIDKARTDSFFKDMGLLYDTAKEKVMDLANKVKGRLQEKFGDNLKSIFRGLLENILMEILNFIENICKMITQICEGLFFSIRMEENNVYKYY